MDPQDLLLFTSASDDEIETWCPVCDRQLLRPPPSMVKSPGAIGADSNARSENGPTVLIKAGHSSTVPSQASPACASGASGQRPAPPTRKKFSTATTGAAKATRPTIHRSRTTNGHLHTRKKTEINLLQAMNQGGGTAPRSKGSQKRKSTPTLDFVDSEVEDRAEVVPPATLRRLNNDQPVSPNTQTGAGPETSMTPAASESTLSSERAISNALRNEKDKSKLRSKSKNKSRPKSLVLDTKTLAQVQSSITVFSANDAIRRASIGMSASDSPQQFTMSPLSLGDLRRRQYCSDECYLRDQKTNSVMKPHVLSLAPSREPSLSSSVATEFSPIQLTTPASDKVYELKRDIKIEMPWFKFRSRTEEYHAQPRPKFDDTDDETIFDNQQPSTVIPVKRPLSKIAKVRLEMEKESLTRARLSMGEMQWLEHGHSSQPLPWWQQEDKEDWESYWKAREEDGLDISLREWTLKRRKQREAKAAKEDRQDAYYSDVRLTLRPDSRKVANRPFLIRQASQPTMNDPNIRSYPSVRMTKDKIETLKREAEFREFGRTNVESVPQSSKPAEEPSRFEGSLPRSPIVKGFNIDPVPKAEMAVGGEDTQKNLMERSNARAPKPSPLKSEASQEIWIHEATLTASPASLNIVPPAPLNATTAVSFTSLPRNATRRVKSRPNISRAQNLGPATNVTNTDAVLSPTSAFLKLSSFPEAPRSILQGQSTRTGQPCGSKHSRPLSIITTCIDGEPCIEGPTVAKKRTLPPLLVMAHASVSTCSTPGTPFEPTLSPFRSTHPLQDEEASGSPQILVENGSGSGSSGEDSNWSPPDIPPMEARQGMNGLRSRIVLSLPEVPHSSPHLRSSMRSHSHTVLHVQDNIDQKDEPTVSAHHSTESVLPDIASLTSDADLALRMYFLLGTPPRVLECGNKKDRKFNSMSRIDANPTSSKKNGSGFFGILESLRR